MIRTNYASYLKGLKVQRQDGATSFYQCTTEFSIGTATRLIRELPDRCEISFFDPASAGDERYIFVRRAGLKTKVMRAGRGFSRWNEESVESVAALLMGSPLVKRPSDEFDSFSVRVIDEPSRQSDRHEEDSLRSPWWKFWRKNA